MIYIIALISGILFKLYDDIVDTTDYKDGSIFIEGLKTATTTALALTLGSDFELSFIFLLYSLECMFEKTADTPYFQTGIIIPIITSIVSLMSYSGPTLVGTGLSLLYITIGLIGTYIEGKNFKEETSLKKSGFRLLFVIILLCVSYVFTFIIPNNTIILFSLFLIGYNVCNLAYQHFFIDYFKSTPISALEQKAKNPKTV